MEKNSGSEEREKNPSNERREEIQQARMVGSNSSSTITDYISDFPEHIIHEILTRLPIRDATRTVVLSKRWEYLWYSFPILDFDEKWFLDMSLSLSIDVMTFREKFIRFLAVSRLRRNTLSHLQKLHIHTLFHCDSELGSQVDAWMDLAMRGEVQTLDLNFSSSDYLRDGFYDVPKIVFSSGSSLINLMLKGCKLMTYSTVNFSSLVKLYLTHVYVMGKTLGTMISSCKFLETLIVQYCYGLGDINVFSPRLKRMVVSGCCIVGMFEVHVPNLNLFKYNANQLKSTGFNPLNSMSFGSLEILSILGIETNDDVIQKIVSNCPSLETLSIHDCSIRSNIKISCEKLKTLEVLDCDHVSKIEIEAPILEFLRYIGKFQSSEVKSLGSKGFSALKWMKLGTISITNESFQLLMSQCPLLEVLVLEYCFGLEYLMISSTYLVSLDVEHCEDLEDVKLDTPNLSSFRYVGMVMEFSEVILSPLLQAELHLKFIDEACDFVIEPMELKQLIQTCSCGSDLTLISETSQYLNILAETLRSSGPALSYLKHLKVKTSLEPVDYIELLVAVLQISLCWGTLSINLDLNSITLKFQDSIREGENDVLNSQNVKHDCLRDHLLEINIDQFQGNDKEMKLMEYLLEKVVSLRIIFISFYEGNDLHRSEIIKRLNNFQRVYSNAEIIYN